MNVKVEEFLTGLGSCIIALLRIPILTLLFIISAFNQSVFARREIVAVELRMLPWRCDIKATTDRLAYVDKLCAENPELADALDSLEPEHEDDDGFPKDFPPDDQCP